MKYIHLILLITVLPGITTSCRKLVEIPPSTTGIASDNVFKDDATAIAALTGFYAEMSSSAGPFTGNTSITHFSALSADEITLYDGFWQDPHLRFYQNDLIMQSQIQAGAELWRPLFSLVFKSNAAIEGLTSDQAQSLNPIIRQQLLGEAKFLRAFFYFHLTNLFGKVPLALASDYKINSLLKKSDESAVYEQIVKDLQEAESLLSNNFPDPTLLQSTNERVRPIKWAAGALLARVYLYQQEYAKAELKATEIIDQEHLFHLTSLDSTFFKNNQEAIWQIQPTDVGFNTWEAVNYVLAPDGLNAGAERSVYLSPQLLSSFEPGDLRKNGKWVDSITAGSATYSYSYKYKLNLYDENITSADAMSEYLTVLRLGEQYLIRAEARARQNKVTGTNSAQSDIDIIRARAGLLGTLASDQTEMLTAIAKERQTELFMEFGHRWFDLKRTGEADAVMSIVTENKGGTWQATDKLFPLPLSDLQKAPNLEQNDGY